MIKSPEQMREAQLMANKAIRAWATDRQVGTKPQTFPEVVRISTKSTKNIKK